MRPAADMHIHYYLIGAVDNADRARQCFGIWAFFRVLLLVLCLRIF